MDAAYLLFITCYLFHGIAVRDDFTDGAEWSRAAAGSCRLDDLAERLVEL
jgi:hypothetical protein